MWIDREGTGAVPLISTMFVLTLVATSMVVFSLLVRSMFQLLITEVLSAIGEKGRVVVEAQRLAIAGRHHRMADEQADDGLVSEGEPVECVR